MILNKEVPLIGGSSSTNLGTANAAAATNIRQVMQAVVGNAPAGNIADESAANVEMADHTG